jgi:hypothetical protein
VTVVDAHSVGTTTSPGFSALGVTGTTYGTTVALTQKYGVVLLNCDSVTILKVVSPFLSGNSFRLLNFKVAFFAFPVIFVVLRKRLLLFTDLALFHVYKRATPEHSSKAASVNQLGSQ